MPESEWFIAGVVVGVLVGFVLGVSVLKTFRGESTASVMFERDEQGRITGIYYVPASGK